jgi:hypothetical protein
MGAWENPSYCWVVIRKNTKAHRGTNLMFGHKIPLGETDTFEPCLSADLFWSSVMNAAKNTRMNHRKS